MNILPNDAQQGQPYDHSKDDRDYQALLAEFPALRAMQWDRRQFAYPRLAKRYGISASLVKTCFAHWLDQQRALERGVE